MFTGRSAVAMNVLAQSAWSAVHNTCWRHTPVCVDGNVGNLSGASKDLYDSASLI
jgi:hypothetical protein